MFTLRARSHSTAALSTPVSHTLQGSPHERAGPHRHLSQVGLAAAHALTVHRRHRGVGVAQPARFLGHPPTPIRTEAGAVRALGPIGRADAFREQPAFRRSTRTTEQARARAAHDAQAGSGTARRIRVWRVRHSTEPAKDANPGRSMSAIRGRPEFSDLFNGWRFRPLPKLRGEWPLNVFPGISCWSSAGSATAGLCQSAVVGVRSGGEAMDSPFEQYPAKYPALRQSVAKSLLDSDGRRPQYFAGIQECLPRGGRRSACRPQGLPTQTVSLLWRW